MDSRFKFRVIDNRDWSDDKGTMYYDAERAYDYLTGIPVNCFGNFFDDDWIVEQCTGLKDKNGNLIYEGDIIKCEIDVKHELTVVWDDGCFGVYVPLHDEFVKFYPLGNFSKHEWDVKNIEIIGNIHENKGE